MADLLVVALMTVAALVPFALATFWMQRGRVGATLVVLALVLAGLMISGWGALTPIGLDPGQALSAALLVFLPALCGGCAGALLGWLIYRRRYT